MSDPLLSGNSANLPGSSFDERETAILDKVLNSGATLSDGPWRRTFEQALREHLGVRHALTTTSGTVSLAIATALLDLGPGDEVITTPQTYQATVQALLATPATVRFCDVDPNTLNLDVDHLADLITERTRAVFLVHYGGTPAPMREIMALTRPRGITVVEDCAHALGAEYFGERPGALGDIGCFSFHSSKTITTLGEGGLVTVGRDAWAHSVERIRGNEAHAEYRDAPVDLPEVPDGLYPGLAYTHDCVTVRHPGTNATLSEPAAAVGLVQLEKLPALSARRRHLAALLDARLADIPGLRLQTVPPGIVAGRHLYTFFVEPGSGIDRDDLIRGLRAEGEPAWQRYFPLHLLPEWRSRGHRLGECPTAERLWFHSQVNLPCRPTLSDSQVERTADAIRRVVRRQHA
jgi:perosamine synthetase